MNSTQEEKLAVVSMCCIGGGVLLFMMITAIRLPIHGEFVLVLCLPFAVVTGFLSRSTRLGQFAFPVSLVLSFFAMVGVVYSIVKTSPQT